MCLHDGFTHFAYALLRIFRFHDAARGTRAICAQSYHPVAIVRRRDARGNHDADFLICFADCLYRILDIVSTCCLARTNEIRRLTEEDIRLELSNRTAFHHRISTDDRQDIQLLGALHRTVKF